MRDEVQRPTGCNRELFVFINMTKIPLDAPQSSSYRMDTAGVMTVVCPLRPAQSKLPSTGHRPAGEPSKSGVSFE